MGPPRCLEVLGDWLFAIVGRGRVEFERHIRGTVVHFELEFCFADTA
jgi:hypothetical protein